VSELLVRLARMDGSSDVRESSKDLLDDLRRDATAL
jgi:hypothetical protein